ncbi:hypothetical protein, partial [Brevibacterium casei]|uniref:hypothetical protein n=1 Tax=Brevibacterium casei TaxID=33889 RepID=UPI001C92F2E0
MDLIGGGCDGQAGGAVAEGVDVDAAALRGDVGPVVGGLEEVDEFAQPGAQGVTGDIGMNRPGDNRGREIGRRRFSLASEIHRR